MVHTGRSLILGQHLCLCLPLVAGGAEFEAFEIVVDPYHFLGCPVADPVTVVIAKTMQNFLRLWSHTVD